MIKARKVNVRFEGNNGQCFERLYSVDIPVLHGEDDARVFPWQYSERPTVKYMFKMNHTYYNCIHAGHEDFIYNFMCGHTLKIGQSRDGLIASVPDRTRYFV